MKKLLLLLAMAFVMSPALHAAEIIEESRACHEAAIATADYNGGTGEQYANDYLETYEACEAYIEEEEVIEHP